MKYRIIQSVSIEGKKGECDLYRIIETDFMFQQGDTICIDGGELTVEYRAFMLDDEMFGQIVDVGVDRYILDASHEWGSLLADFQQKKWLPFSSSADLHDLCFPDDDDDVQIPSVPMTVKGVMQYLSDYADDDIVLFHADPGDNLDRFFRTVKQIDTFDYVDGRDSLQNKAIEDLDEVGIKKARCVVLWAHHDDVSMAHVAAMSSEDFKQTEIVDNESKN